MISLSTLDGSNGFRLDGAAANELSGFAVSTAGDINGDGLDDLIIGAYFAATNSPGRSYVLFGHTGSFNSAIDLSSLNGSNGFRLDGVAAFDYSGFSVNAAGDINGDGLDDLIVGADGADPNGISVAGSSYVVFGRTGSFSSAINFSTLNGGSSGFRLDGVASLNFSGFSVSAAGDINDDGFDDLIVGAPAFFTNTSGFSYVLFGHSGAFANVINLSSLNGSNGFRLDGVAVNDYSGCVVSAAGDINGDGLDDLIVGAYGADPSGNASGSSYVLFGRTGGDTAFASVVDLSSLDGSTGFRLDGMATGDKSGSAAAAAGDINGDGHDDLIVGANGADPSGNASGSSYVLFGRTGGDTAFASVIDLSSLNGNTGFRLDGIASGDRSGSAVAPAGDINGDSLDDLVVGAPFADPNGSASGSSYVLFGNRAPLATGGTAALPDISVEDTAEPNGTRIDVLAAPFYLDMDPFFGAAVTAPAPISASGVWEYRLNAAAAWGLIPTADLDNTNALVLVAESELRFLPALGFVGNLPFLTLRMWDGVDGYAAGEGRDILSSIGSLGGFSNDDNLLQITGIVFSDVLFRDGFEN